MAATTAATCMTATTTTTARPRRPSVASAALTAASLLLLGTSSAAPAASAAAGAFAPPPHVPSRRCAAPPPTSAAASTVGSGGRLGLSAAPSRPALGRGGRGRGRELRAAFLIVVNDDDDEDEDEEEEEEEEEDDKEPDPYMERAASEFADSPPAVARNSSLTAASTSSSSSSPPRIRPPVGSTPLDWGGAYGTLSERINDARSGRVGPANAMFRMMAADAPNRAIGTFVNEADPGVVAAMSGAVGSLLGGLSNPSAGVETIVRATKEKLGNLCFQLQMTGYMFRNAEYVLALKDLMNIRGTAALDDYRDAFRRVDMDDSGFVDADEVEDLLSDAYDGKTPAFEVEAFLRFFDRDEDGRISWEEFGRGLGAVYAAEGEGRNGRALLPGDARDDYDEYEDDDDDDDDPFGEPAVSGKVRVELEGGKVIEIEAGDYIDSMRREAAALREALRRETGGGERNGGRNGASPPSSSAAGGLPGMLVGPGQQQQRPSASDEVGGIGGYIASLRGDVKSLTEGISPEVVEAMKLLIDFVLEGGPGGRGGGSKKDETEKDAEMELPGSALQQLALWQLVLGYRLREAEATGEYRKMLES